MDRRAFLMAGGLAVATTGAWAAQRKIPAASPLAATIEGLERRSGGRLGVAVRDTATGWRFANRGGERFPMCSTFKFALAAAVLKQVELGRERLDRTLAIKPSDMVGNSPFVARRIGGAATVAELCEATTIFSDNAAANLLLPIIGGPAGLTRQFRAWGDAVTRLDRIEPMMSESTPGDPRDTTSPDAMLGLMERLTLGTLLAPAGRARLTAWLVDNRTGGARLRAGLPKGWRVGDKTGSGDHGTTNDVAILWPPRRKPLLISAYLTGSKLDGDGRNAILAEVARAVAATV